MQDLLVVLNYLKNYFTLIFYPLDPHREPYPHYNMPYTNPHKFQAGWRNLYSLIGAGLELHPRRLPGARLYSLHCRVQPGVQQRWGAGSLRRCGGSAPAGHPVPGWFQVPGREGINLAKLTTLFVSLVYVWFSYKMLFCSTTKLFIHLIEVVASGLNNELPEFLLQALTVHRFPSPCRIFNLLSSS